MFRLRIMCSLLIFLWTPSGEKRFFFLFLSNLHGNADCLLCNCVKGLCLPISRRKKGRGLHLTRELPEIIYIYIWALHIFVPCRHRLSDRMAYVRPLVIRFPQTSRTHGHRHQQRDCRLQRGCIRLPLCGRRRSIDVLRAAPAIAYFCFGGLLYPTPSSPTQIHTHTHTHTWCVAQWIYTYTCTYFIENVHTVLFAINLPLSLFLSYLLVTSPTLCIPIHHFSHYPSTLSISPT